MSVITARAAITPSNDDIVDGDTAMNYHDAVVNENRKTRKQLPTSDDDDGTMAKASKKPQSEGNINEGNPAVRGSKSAAICKVSKVRSFTFILYFNNLLHTKRVQLRAALEMQKL